MFKGFQDKGFSGIKACFFRAKRTFWVNYKRTEEVDALRLRPHPYEFFLYYDI